MRQPERQPLNVLAVGATGSIGTHVVDEALSAGHQVRALVRSPGKLNLRPGLEIAVADLTQPASLAAAVEGIDAIVFTHGTYGGPRDAELVDYGGVRNVLAALGGMEVRIALMTAIAVTDRKGAHDWKRRGERLVRISGNPYTIVRPGWFDYNVADQFRLTFLQGDKRQSGTPRDGVIARRQIARVLVRSLTSEAALRKTFEVIAETGLEQADFDPLFAALDADPAGSLDAAHDTANMAVEKEPPSVIRDLKDLEV
ncbi:MULTISPECIES: SDR family oxidoreductase [unclassified Mesorhizobium]|uniref:SDR family oxidoreductase n=1 Tax=unclassified Mesorhizobium TaxID=325217 RepID=UPI00112A2A1A|nr:MULTISPECIES: SDR family oxidoreductase [unclassified Mesorhizobium]MBZ9700544.1 SDR family oxidoreductase [Mesorhizobium sp. CO1-1-3]MBZ9946480.1 SDR family oxidoreductase [Mesorhizobium sp. BR1-1-11]TPI96529.1 SDR family oxidoreductase [Mesorhizobium sp. B2-8-1]